jgi:hypothetical protein
MRIMHVLFLMVATSPVAAQIRPAFVAPAALEDVAQAQSRDAWKNGGSAAVGAILGGGLGLIAGAYVTGLLLSGSCEELQCLGVAFMGGAIGSALGIGLGAHLGNGRRGNALADIGASLGVLLVGIAVGQAADLPGELLLVIPMSQIVAAVVTEVEVGKAR